MPSQPLRVFISYSHDSTQHKDLVLSFAERLRKDGIDAQIDQYVKGRPLEGWPRWMLDKLDCAEFVLLICTETYYRRFRGHEEPDKGRGVDWEGQLITLEIYNAKSHAAKFAPVIFGSKDREFIPEPLSDQFYLLNSEDGYQELYSLLTGQAGVDPRALGEQKRLAREAIEPLRFDQPGAGKPVALWRMPPGLDFNGTLTRIEEIRRRTSGINEEKLETLLYYIEEGGVIPIIGQQLVTFMREGSQRTLYELMARSLAAELRIPANRLVQNFSLNDVIEAHRPFATDRRLIYQKLYELLCSEPFRSLPIPTPILQLAAIRDFAFFVSTTFDNFLEQALDLAWSGGHSTRVRAFSPYTPVDLQEGDTDKRGPPVVFKLFGQASADPYFAATDADVIEFIHRLQYDKRPIKLFAQLKKSHLLILGTDYPDWLARLFLRIARDEILWVDREKLEYFADRQLEADSRLISFIRHFSKSTECFTAVSPEAFVERLFAEWLARDPARAVVGQRIVPEVRLPRPEESVYLSYAPEDQDAALRIKNSLESIGWPVWFDSKDQGSDLEYENLIERTIKAAQACVVVLSPVTGASEASFFHREWQWAIERQSSFTGIDRAFIHPLRLTADTLVPPVLQAFNPLDAFGGEPVPLFIDSMTRILRQLRKERR
jgi:SEFIR domain/TIR domain/SIR2-like domain